MVEVTIEEMYRTLRENGYEEFNCPSHERDYRLSCWQATRDFRPYCEANEHSVINVYLNRAQMPSGEPHMSADVEICAETPRGRWCKLQIYSLRWSELDRGLDKLEAQLIAAWKAVVGAEGHGENDSCEE